MKTLKRFFVQNFAKQMVVILVFAMLSCSCVFAENISEDDVYNKEKVQKRVEEIKLDVREAYQDGKVSQQELYEIENKYPDSVIKEYKKLEAEELKEKLNMVTLPENAKERIIQIPLESGGYLKAQVYDLAENETIPENEEQTWENNKYAKEQEGTILSKVISLVEPEPCYAATPPIGLTVCDHIVYRDNYHKKFGDRYFTAKFEYGVLVGRVKLTLENHYTITKKGLNERYGKVRKDVSCLNRTIKILNDTPKWKITDSTASSVGQDINLKGWITFAIDAKYYYKEECNFLLDTRVKIRKKTSTGAEVCEHVYISKDFV